MLGGLVDGSPVNREDSPDHVCEDESDHSADDFKVGCPRPGGFWVLAQEPVGEKTIFGGIAMNVRVNRSEVITRLEAARCLHLRKLNVECRQRNWKGYWDVIVNRPPLFIPKLNRGGSWPRWSRRGRKTGLPSGGYKTLLTDHPNPARAAGCAISRKTRGARWSAHSAGILTLLTSHSQNVYCASASGMASRSQATIPTSDRHLQVISHLRAEEDAFQPNGHDCIHSHPLRREPLTGLPCSAPT